jgi:hypothetical protein
VFVTQKQENPAKNEKKFQKMGKNFKNPLEKAKKIWYSNEKQSPKQGFLRKDFLGGNHYEQYQRRQNQKHCNRWTQR